MPWHSTQRREELLLVLAGRVRLETQPSNGRVRALAVRAGQSVFLPRETIHQVVNPSKGQARYVYITAQAS